jgi:hypothetical protein
MRVSFLMRTTALAGLMLMAAVPAVAGAEARTPRADSPLQWWPLLVLPGAGLWLVLAFERTRRLDPNYPRARARAKLARHLARLGPAPSLPELETWCGLTAQLLSVNRAAPTRRDIFDGLALAPEITDPLAWQRLWTEARAALFSAGHRVPPDWVERARIALRQTVIQRATPWFPQQRAHWLPPGVMGLCLFLLLPMPADAVTPEIIPRDWATYHGAAAAYAREENWDAAVAHGTAAFALAPREKLVITGLRQSLAQVGRIDPGLRPLVAGTRFEQAVASASPGEWQEAVWWFLALGAAGGCAAVGGLYGNRGWLRVGAATLVIGITGVVVSARALALYGLLARPNAACLTRETDLRDIPSDLVEIRQTAPLLAGTIVTIEGNYFGWTRIMGRGNLAGWVRRDAVLPLYGPANDAGASGFNRRARQGGD